MLDVKVTLCVARPLARVLAAGGGAGLEAFSAVPPPGIGGLHSQI